ncbi:MAG: leucine-rich repeat domain-containing protein [Candidatus Margulisbacteria bacterium]|jgi:hypothetical protein|nr:leucine-rich repeat domain-containing protein [Candidatus Margulisiibacteriota bacterium]
MKKFWTFAVLILNISLFCSAANPARDFIYEPNEAGDGIVITGYQGKKGGRIVIPDKIEGLPVVKFDCGPLDGWSEGLMYLSVNKKNIKRKLKDGSIRPRITKVIFPDSITEISAGEFGGTFESCTELKSVTLPDKVRAIPGLFSNNNPRLVNIKMPREVEIIGESAFSGCENLKSIELPEGLKVIADYAFSGCGQLRSIKIPRSIEKIGSMAFGSCAELTKLDIPDKPIRYVSIELTFDAQLREYERADNSAFAGCSRLPLSARQKILNTGYQGRFN